MLANTIECRRTGTGEGEGGGGGGEQQFVASWLVCAECQKSTWSAVEAEISAPNTNVIDCHTLSHTHIDCHTHCHAHVASLAGNCQVTLSPSHCDLNCVSSVLRQLRKMLDKFKGYCQSWPLCGLASALKEIGAGFKVPAYWVRNEASKLNLFEWEKGLKRFKKVWICLNRFK